MARRKKRSRFREFAHEALDEVAGVGSVWGGIGLTHQYKDFLEDTRRAYYKNIRGATSKSASLPPLKTGWGYDPSQRQYGFIKKIDRSIKMDPLLTKAEGSKLRILVKNNFSRPTRGRKFRFFADAKKYYKAVRSPYYSKSGRAFKPSQEALSYLNKRNKASLRKILRKNWLKFGALGALTFGAIPAAQGIQARYAPKRKVKKEFKKRVYRGTITPVKGYVYGSALDKALAKYPALRGSRRVRSLEGKYAQMYGQGVQFYRGTSGMSSEDIQKLDRDLKRIVEQKRRAKRRRGK